MYWCIWRCFGDIFRARTEDWDGQYIANSDGCESSIKFKKH